MTRTPVALFLAAATATAALAALPAAAGGDAHAVTVAEGMLVTAERLRIQVFHINYINFYAYPQLAFSINGSSSLFSNPDFSGYAGVSGSPSHNYSTFASVHSVDVGPDGSIVAIDGRSAADYRRDGMDVTPIVVFHPNGTFNFRFGSPDQVGVRVAVGPDGRIVTASIRYTQVEVHPNGTSYSVCMPRESCVPHHISVFHPNGTLDFSFGYNGTGPGHSADGKFRNIKSGT